MITLLLIWSLCFFISEEARKKKFGKKKKKQLHKLMMIGMLIKSKLGLLMQLLSTHFQVKFFIIAIISLIINVARFWIDLKKSYKPSKVIYYEHAQHQHHYDHDDDHGIWGRSSDESTPQELAYSSYNPERKWFTLDSLLASSGPSYSIN